MKLDPMGQLNRYCKKTIFTLAEMLMKQAGYATGA